MWGLIDCDNFFCSCERVFRPDLAGRPIVVLSNNDGCIVSRSPEAKAMGVDDIMPYHKMLERFPNSGITAFSSNYLLYGDMSARVMALLKQEISGVYQYSIDEAFLDLSGIDVSTLKKWGEELCAKVKKWTGIPVSLGIAPTKTLAKVASRYAKTYPGYHKCCLIDGEEQRVKALRMFPVGKVWGIGRRTAAALARYDVLTAYDFTTKSRSWIRSKFHVTGERTWYELRGFPMISTDSLDEVTKQSIMTSRSFPGMITDFEKVRTHVANYAARCALKLRRQKSVCGMVTVFVQSNRFREDLPQYSNSASFHFPTSTNTSTEIIETATNILTGIFRPGIHYKRAGVMVSDISSAAAIQPDLFYFNPAQRHKLCKISEIIDEINNRLGADTIVIAAQQYAEKSDDGKSLKFCNAIRRALKSPEYSTSINAFKVR